MWTYVMIGFVLYIFALAATSLIGRPMTESEEAVLYFGTVPSSMFTLFQIMTLDSWTSVVRPIAALQPWTTWFFIFFISVTVFVLVNLITAVIVQNAFDCSNEDEADLALIRAREKEQ